MSDAIWAMQETRANIIEQNAAIIARLQDALRDALANVIPAGGEYALLDFPNHSNIGDSAIYVGESLLCREHFGKEPKLVCVASDGEMDRLSRLDPAVILLLHGGGNFGDLYPRHQNFREAVLARFPDRKVVQLPQSVHFREDANLAHAGSVINAHPDFTLMVRDRVSLSISKRHFECATILVPDMAFMIGPSEPSRLPDLRLLSLIREDEESVLANKEALGRLPQPSETADWPREERAKHPADSLPRSIRQFLPPGRQGPRPASPAAYEWLARKRVQIGFDILSRGEAVLTDRLHAHILSFLLGKPQIILDNSYGKIGRFVDVWTRGGGFVQASSLNDVIERLAEHQHVQN